MLWLGRRDSVPLWGPASRMLRGNIGWDRKLRWEQLIRWSCTTRTMCAMHAVKLYVHWWFKSMGCKKVKHLCSLRIEYLLLPSHHFFTDEWCDHSCSLRLISMLWFQSTSTESTARGSTVANWILQEPRQWIALTGAHKRILFHFNIHLSNTRTGSINTTSKRKACDFLTAKVLQLEKK